jgi:L-asparaginase
MVDSPRGLVPGADLKGWLALLVAGTDLADGVDITEFPHLIDSSNATPDDWQAIVADLWAHRDQADAFVVIHGTDTMAYTSAALSYALTDFGKPVVVTGSQYPISVVGSDAAPNVTGALRAATSGKAPGVSLFFGHRLLAGPRATKVSSWAFRGFDSPSVSLLARTGAPWRWGQPPAAGCGWADPRPYQRQDVVVVDLAPGITARRLAALVDPLPQAVILRAYGVGNAPNEEPGLPQVIAGVVKAGVPVIVASQCYQANVMLGHYEAGDVLAQAGAIGSGDMTLEATYAKTVFLLSQGLTGPELTDWMCRNIAGELTEA